MKAVVFDNVNRWRVQSPPDPQPREGEALVKVAACGVCGTDLHILHGEFPATFPLIPGHEFAGTIVQTGPGVQDLQVGDRVCVDPNIYCRRCRFCREGKIHLCENLDPIGVRRNGGFAELCPVPQAQVYRLPDRLSFEEGAFVEPLSCVVHGIDLAGIQPGQRVLILGGGTIGGLLAQAARAAGAARVVVSEPHPERRKLLLATAADEALDPRAQSLPRDADVIFEAAGLAVTARQALTVAQKGATIIFFGVVAPRERIEISPYDVFANEWTIRGSFINPNTVQRAIDLMASGRIKVKPFLSHRFGLDQFNEALKTFGRPDSYKIQLIPN